MVTSESLGAEFRPAAPFKVEEKQRRRERQSRSYKGFAGVYRPTRPEVGVDFSKLRGVRERRVPRVGAQAEADEDEKAGRGGERVSLDEGAGAAALSGFTLQWSRTIPPSAAVPCSPRPLLHLVRSSPAIRVLVALRHRPSIFYSIDSPCRPCRRCTTRFAALCMCILACIRCEGLDWTIWVHGGPKRPCSNVPWSNVFQCNGKQRRSPRDQSRVLNFISAARLDAPERF